ncbi:MAG: hypothetical protein RBS28_10690 [Rhodocyclaceae bacterium]|nr:hypothetical protein [Rhodocyclaceae bacterium]
MSTNVLSVRSLSVKVAKEREHKMMRRKDGIVFRGVCGMIAMLGIAAVAFAQAQGGAVRGNTSINAAVGAQTSIAVGAGNKAQSNVGVVKGSAGGKTDINAVVGNQTTIAVGAGNKAQGNVGVAKNVGGNTQINAAVGNMTTIAAGAGNTAKTNVGVVKDRSNAKVTVGVGSVTNVVGGAGQKGCINIGTKGVDGCE